MGNQRTFASMAWNEKARSNPARAVPRRDGCGDSGAAAGPAVRAALPASRTKSNRCDWRRCYGFTSCSSGSFSRTRGPKTRPTAASRCVALHGSSHAVSAATIAGLTVTRSPFSQPDCHDYFKQSLCTATGTKPPSLPSACESKLRLGQQIL
jgi:hypothetical protein